MIAGRVVKVQRMISYSLYRQSGLHLFNLDVYMKTAVQVCCLYVIASMLHSL